MRRSTDPPVEELVEKKPARSRRGSAKKEKSVKEASAAGKLEPDAVPGKDESLPISDAADKEPASIKSDLPPVLEKENLPPILGKGELPPVLEKEDLPPVLRKEDLPPVLGKEGLPPIPGIAVVNIEVQYGGNSWKAGDLSERAKEHWAKNNNRDAAEARSLELYIKPEEGKAYYVINGDGLGDIDL